MAEWVIEPLRPAHERAADACSKAALDTFYVVEGPLETPSGQSPLVRRVWIVDAGRDGPRLVTVYRCQEGE